RYTRGRGIFGLIRLAESVDDRTRRMSLDPVRRTCTRVAVLLLLTTLVRASDIEITYLANEGVLIQCEDEKILVDALFRDSLDEYARHSPGVQEKLETGQAPFDGVRFALATHFHLDHWDAGAITRFLRSNPKALFV